MQVKQILWAGLLCMAFIAQGADERPPFYQKGGRFKPDEQVVYKTVGEDDLVLDVFYPPELKDGESRPAVVFFFGGGWKNGDPRQFYHQSNYLASRGMVAICADYRTASRHNAKPYECVADAKSAMRYVRKHAAELSVDPDRLAAGGGSAGGHLAAATAVIKAYDCPEDDLSVSPVPNALLLYNPACDNSPEGYGHERIADDWKKFSPMENLEGKVPPTLILLGEHDGVFTPERAAVYQDRMQANGNRCELIVYPDQRHGFYNLDRKKHGFDKEKNRKYFLATLTEVDRFLESLGYISGEPTAEAWFAEHEALNH